MKTNLNFLPYSVQRKEVVQNCLMRWSFLAAACLLGMTIFGWHKSKLAATKKVEVAKLEQRHEDLVKLKTGVDALENLLNPANLNEPVFNAGKKYPILSLLATISEATATSDGKLSIQNFHFEQLQEIATNEDNFEVMLDGIATDAMAVDTFTEYLKASKLFRNVKVVSTTDGERNQFPVIIYKILAVF